MVDVVGLVCCDASMLSAVRIVLSTLRTCIRTLSRFFGPVVDVFVSLLHQVEMYQVWSFVLLHSSLVACVNVKCPGGLDGEILLKHLSAFLQKRFMEKCTLPLS